mgnify:CR=1 FL=1
MTFVDKLRDMIDKRSQYVGDFLEAHAAEIEALVKAAIALKQRYEEDRRTITPSIGRLFDALDALNKEEK